MDSDSNPLWHRDRDNVLPLIPNPSDRKLHTAAADPAVGLKLGKRTYFDRSSSHSTSKSKASHHHGGAPSARCQVEGCGTDLSTAKDYHRKHRVCVNHSKSAKVVVAGEVRRFCQQCSRFHELSAFDEKKRSCRRRLSDHNARRRKPQPNVISFGSSRFYDLPRMNLHWNRAPSDHVRPNASFAWEELCDSKLTQTRDSWIMSTKVGDIDTKLHCSSNVLSTNVSPLHHDRDRLLPFKGTTAEVLNQGLEPSAVASDLDRAPDLRCALSLLSYDYWGLPEPHPTCLVNNSLDTLNVGATQLALPLESATSGYCHEKQHQVQQAHVLSFDLHRDGGQPFGAAYFHSSLI